MPEKFEQYGHDKAWDESEKIKDKVKSGEAESYSDAEMKIEYEKQDPDPEWQEFEFEFSPEIIEKIMDKVQDINGKGTAYTVIDRGSYERNMSKSILKHILEEGFNPRGGTNYFNIVGRSVESVRLENRRIRGMEIKNSFWFDEKVSNIVFIIDIKDSEEVEEIKSSDCIGKYQLEPAYLPGIIEKTFGEVPRGESEIKNHPKFEEMKKNGYIDEMGRANPFTEYGFISFGSIEQDRFRGVVIKDVDKRLLNFIVNEMIKNYHHEKGNMLLPIYDTDGNLLWPKNMKYDEVKKFIEERDKKI